MFFEIFVNRQTNWSNSASSCSEETRSGRGRFFSADDYADRGESAGGAAESESAVRSRGLRQRGLRCGKVLGVPQLRGLLPRRKTPRELGRPHRTSFGKTEHHGAVQFRGGKRGFAFTTFCVWNNFPLISERSAWCSAESGGRKAVPQLSLRAGRFQVFGEDRSRISCENCIHWHCVVHTNDSRRSRIKNENTAAVRKLHHRQIVPPVVYARVGFESALNES
ncbi:MAG: hypothetical protein GY820_21325 [Gammaproteobacteria bacterium]|nr:hypothetical protein [Gammaproteobacteria bacterium]